MRPENYEAQRHPPSHEYELFIGPNHPGIEGNYAFKLRLDGDRVIEGKADAGYLHRGFEKLMEGRLWIQNLAITPRICVPDPAPMEVAYVLAVEDLCGLEVPATGAVAAGHGTGTFAHRRPPLHLRRARGHHRDV